MPAQKSGGSSVAKTSAERTLVIKRTFDAPRELVWKAWTDVKQAKQWWGPKGFTAPLVELDNREGGLWRARMRSPDGKDYWQHGVTREIVPPERLSFTFIWDEHPEEEMLVTVTLVDRGGKTEMTFRQEGFKSVEDRDGHEGGWNESFDRLVAYLKKAKPAK
ncbi:MAG TPA: SRPBCC domain-containing protein [Gemmatimonadaceae bacterium]|nr:SRPBCC domain-containing protein [Gemmatimonadaceae bacterium]